MDHFRSTGLIHRVKEHSPTIHVEMGIGSTPADQDMLLPQAGLARVKA